MNETDMCVFKESYFLRNYNKFYKLNLYSGQNKVRVFYEVYQSKPDFKLYVMIMMMMMMMMMIMMMMMMMMMMKMNQNHPIS